MRDAKNSPVHIKSVRNGFLLLKAAVASCRTTDSKHYKSITMFLHMLPSVTLTCCTSHEM